MVSAEGTTPADPLDPDEKWRERKREKEREREMKVRPGRTNEKRGIGCAWRPRGLRRVKGMPAKRDRVDEAYAQRTKLDPRLLRFCEGPSFFPFGRIAFRVCNGKR